MNKNRQLNALGLGGQLATNQRGQDLGYLQQTLAAAQGNQQAALGARSQDLGYLGQQLAAMQGDQSTALGARGQDLQGALANQGTQLSLEQLRGQLGLGARAQDLSAAQGNQATQLGARGQDLTARAQDLSALQTDADRQLAAQQLALQGQLGLTGLGLQAQGQGLGYSQAANALGLAGEGMAQDAINQANNRLVQIDQGNQNRDLQMLMQQNELNSRPGFWEQLALNTFGGVTNAAGQYVTGGILGGGSPAAAAPVAAPPAATGSIFAPPQPNPLYGSSAWNQIGTYS